MNLNFSSPLKSDIGKLRKKYLEYKSLVERGHDRKQALSIAGLTDYEDFLDNVESLITKEHMTEDSAILISSLITFND